MAMQSIDVRAKAVGLSLARLGRESGVSYRRIWEGKPLRRDEVFRIEAVLASAEQGKAAAVGTTRTAAKEVEAVDDPDELRAET